MAHRTWDMMLVIGALATASVVLAAVGYAAVGTDALNGEADRPTPAERAGEGDEPETLRCENPVDGFAVRYPADWSTNDDSETIPCRAFDPEPLELDPATQIPLDTAVIMTTAGGELGLFAREIDEVGEHDPTVEHERVEETEVAGRDAIVIDAVGTGDGLIPEGVAFRSYHIDLDDRIVVASSYDLGEPAFEEKLETLERMVETVEPLSDGGSG